MPCVKIKYQDEKFVYQPLIDAVNKLCVAKNKDCLCTSGYRSLEKQKIINKQVLDTRKGAYQLPSGAVYTGTGANKKCWASAYGQSNHCYTIALDISDEWFKVLGNDELKKFQLIKPISYEPWHVQLLEHQGISQGQKVKIRDSVLNGKGDNMNSVQKDTQSAQVDELAEAIKFLSVKSGINYDVWYKTAKDVNYLDKCFIKIANAFQK